MDDKVRKEKAGVSVRFGKAVSILLLIIVPMILVAVTFLIYHGVISI